MRCLMWPSKHSIERNNNNNGRTLVGKKYRKIDQQLLNLVYHKSKLETIDETLAVLGGYAIIARVEFSSDSYPNVPSRDGVLTACAIVSCLLINVHLLALLIIIRAAVFLHPKDLESIEHNAITNVASLHISSTTTLTTRISGNR
ncbi:unnamed protein product [Rotaria socialis]|uniref:Uncharacterized protein n=1 Tax=Rotaria socialis TaxID=392032 RepID=A0A819UNJ4_9BILA|nr:unnamed protein product [Rotaria socialis]CAF4098173.1 unnamed protein product [Rotaria socialis]